MYEATDRYLEKLKSRIRIEFNHLSVLGFDELNVLNTRKQVDEIYDRLKDFNETEYQKIASAGYREGVETVRNTPKVQHNSELRSVVQSGVGDSYYIVHELLHGYNPVTKYVYNNEADRKRARQIEIMLSDREILDRVAYEKDIRHAADLWYTQSSQYGQDIEDRAYAQALIDCGVHHVQWVAEHDEKTCNHCKSMDGNIYPVEKIPPKQHYRCRCYWLPID